MRYSLIAAFLLASVVIPGWCDSREDQPIYEPDSATISNQIQDSHYDPSYPHPRQTADRKSYYQQSDLHYAMPHEHGQANNYQYRQQAHRQLTKEEESALSNLALRHKEESEHEDEEKGDGSAMYHHMRQGGNNFAQTFYPRPNMMMNGPHNYRPPQFIPPKFTMEQQIQMQMQRQQMHQRMMAAAQAQALMNQQPQHFIQPPAQQFAQPPPQQLLQHYQQPAPIAGQAPPQVDNYPGSRVAAPPAKPRYQPPPPPSPTPKVRYAQPATTAQPWAPPTPQSYYDDYETRNKE